MQYGTWTEVNDANAFDAAMKLARGVYQRNLLRGTEALSGSTLKGKASRYIGRYRDSRDNLIARIEAADIAITERKGPHGKRILVIG